MAESPDLEAEVVAAITAVKVWNRLTADEIRSLARAAIHAFCEYERRQCAARGISMEEYKQFLERKTR